MHSKTCIVCAITFQVDKFHPHQKFCSVGCRAKVQNQKRVEYKRKWSQLNKEKVRKSQLKYLQNNPDGLQG